MPINGFADSRHGGISSPTSTLPVAVDTMAGDNGLPAVLQGAIQAKLEHGIASILVGPETEINSLLRSLGATDLGLEIVHAPTVITMEESPTKAVRKKPDSSLCVAYRLLDSGRAGSMISTGNSGAMMAAGSLICGLLPGIERPAIATLIPTSGDTQPNVLLDMGANVDCHARNLVQFAVMGAVYCTSLLGKERPKVALLSNGSEPSKGTDVLRAAAVVLKQLEVVDYIGYVEGRDIPSPVADVIVCDGFVGNVVLKSLEGCVRLVADQIRLESSKTAMGRLGALLLRGTFRRLFQEKFDYTAHGGAPLLGLRKLALVLHGSSDARAVKNAIRIADTFSKLRMIDRISSALSLLEENALDIGTASVDGMFSVGRSSGAAERAAAAPGASGEPSED